MAEKRTSVFENGLIWFGAAMSVAEIMAGALIAPLGLAKGLAAILIGHAAGCALFYFAGLLGAERGMSAMETVKLSFGRRGAAFFSAVNVLQLVGWTAVMIAAGAAGADAILPAQGRWLWGLIIGVLILAWLLVGVRNLGKLNLAAVGGLFVLSVVLSAVVFGGRGQSAPAGGGITFGQAVELSAAMPVSWLPLVSDYTRHAAKKRASSLVSALVYFFASSWMYAIGLGAAIFAGDSDIARIMVGAGMGALGLFVVVFSTVTTAFLDAYSAGVSAVTISGRVGEKWAAAAVCAVGTALSVFAPVLDLEPFLYLIGSVFAPMFAVLITDAFILKKDSSGLELSRENFAIWAAGLVIYRLFLRLDTPLGSTLPAMAATGLLCVLAHAVKTKRKEGSEKC